MARNQTLLKILNDVRGEARLSLNPAHNIADRDQQISLIQREQERLWTDHDWPHLTVERYIPLVEGRRFYDPRVATNEAGDPKGDLSFERILQVAVQQDRLWRKLDYGISAYDRMTYNSHDDERSWPPRRWWRAEDDVIEIWPIPDQTAALPDMQGMLRVTGIRDLKPFRDDADRADLDDRLLVLYSAAAILAESGAKDTNLKLEAAQRHYGRLKADQDQRETFSLYGTRCRPRYRGVYVKPE